MEGFLKKTARLKILGSAAIYYSSTTHDHEKPLHWKTTWKQDEKAIPQKQNFSLRIRSLWYSVKITRLFFFKIYLFWLISNIENPRVNTVNKISFLLRIFTTFTNDKKKTILIFVSFQFICTVCVMQAMYFYQCERRRKFKTRKAWSWQNRNLYYNKILNLP